MTSQQQDLPVASFTPLAKLLHWLVAALVFVQFTLAWQAEAAAGNNDSLLQLNILAHHKSIGMTLLALMCLRIIWRFKNTPPDLPGSMPTWQKKLAHYSHVIVYGALLVLPISGWLGSSAKAFSVSWFSLFSFPDLVTANAELGETLYKIHGLSAFILLLFVLLHILAALKHHWVDKDLVLGRMLTPLWGGCFVLFLIISIFLTRNTQDNIEDIVQENVELTSINIEDKTSLANNGSSLEPWLIDYLMSTTKFFGEQAGAEFEGAFNAWEAQIYFDSTLLEESYFEVEFDLSQIETGSGDRNTQLQKEPFFFVDQFPKAKFVTNNISLLGDGRYLAESSLNLKGIETPVLFYFTVDELDGQFILSGKAELDRLEMMVGTGTWSNIKSIGQMVEVTVKVVTTI